MLLYCFIALLSYCFIVLLRKKRYNNTTIRATKTIQQYNNTTIQQYNNTTVKMNFKYFIPAVLWAVIIFWLSATPGERMPDLSFWNLLQPDKVGHLGVYAILVAATLWAFYRFYERNKIPFVVVLSVVFFAILYGIGIEFMQFYFFSGRNFDVLDILANIMGCLIGLLSLRFFRYA